MPAIPGSFLLHPKVRPPLDPAFRPSCLAHALFESTARESGGERVGLAVEQADGSVFHFETQVLPDTSAHARENYRHLERLLKFFLWSRGGFRVYVMGPRPLAQSLAVHYAEVETGKFDAQLMGGRIYERTFEIVPCESLPPARSETKLLGRHFQGCRIGFDLGASDRKVAAVIDGRVVFSEEFLWDPVPQSDPQWHYERIVEVLKTAATHLPRVDAIGGSAAGVYVNNRVMVASLFRGVPGAAFEREIKSIFLRIKEAMGGIPFEVANDGEVTALAGAMALKRNNVLGIAMGSSEAAGYVTGEGAITSWLNELAFAPIDHNPGAPLDEWSGDRGCGVQYLSQQAVGRLLVAAEVEVAPGSSLPEQLKTVQELMKAGDPRAAAIYETIGVYFGYAMCHYAHFYKIEVVLALGRVMSGEGGDLIVQMARKVLAEERPELSVLVHVPGEKEKRHGQAMAAASLAETAG